MGDALTFGEEGIVAHAGEKIIGHAAEETPEHAAVQVEEEVVERMEVEAEKIHKHHSDPKFLSCDKDQPLTNMTEGDHQQLHRDLNDHLVNYEDAAGNHMRPKPRNSGARIRGNFSTNERLKALSDFSKGPGSKYTEAAKEFFQLHPTLK